MTTYRSVATPMSVALAACVVAYSVPAAAQDLACGEAYTVARGDSLSKIARRAYGDRRRYVEIFEANAGVIGSNPSMIRVGMELMVPCGDDQAAAAPAEEAEPEPAAAEPESTEPVTAAEVASAAPVQPASQPAPGTPDRPIRVLTAGNWAPYLDEDDAQGGMFPEITRAAFAAANPAPAYKIDFINDWGAHLRPLIADHAYDLGLAWFRPNCDVVERLGDGSKFRCNNLNWSEPLFEQPVAYYMRADEAVPADHAALMGRHLCRPAGYSMFMVEEHNLVEPNVTITRADSPQGCFEGLLSGELDVVVIARDVGEGTLTELDAKDQAVEMEGLTQIATLNMVIAKDHPEGEKILAIFDQGLNAIKESTEWFQIVRRHIEAHRQKTQ